ncbi:MAG: CDP-paratose 2-epimerase [Candidatus Rokuibacteriota bacterium]|nr:MAG: CDP-paratose 2-epimerase [Candidatus Rokubacteria bacterium]
MADHVHESRAWVARPREEVFAFFADPANLRIVTPPSLAFRLLEPVAAMEAGAVFDYRIRWLGVPLRWRAFIREYDPPFRFIDVQVRGPYSRWEHRHLFLSEAGGTWIEDHVRYRLPLGPIGRAAHVVLVRRQLEKIWLFRDRAIAERFGPLRR